MSDDNGPLGYRKGPLWIAIDNFLNNLRPIIWIEAWYERVRKREQEIKELIDKAWDLNPGIVKLGVAINIVFASVYVICGWAFLKTGLEKDANEPMVEQFSGMIEDFWNQAFNEGPWADVIELIGEFTSEPVLALFEDLTAEEVKDPRRFLRRMHGTMISLTAAPGIINTILSAGTAGKVTNATKLLEGIYWNFGLGFLGWQSISPMMNAGMLAVLERHYNQKFRPKRFTISELRDLYALGEIGEETLEQGAREQGIPENDIQMWKKLAFRTLSEGDVHAALKANLIDQDEWSRRIRALGFDPVDYNILFALNCRDDVDEAKTVTLSTSKRAFREGLMGEDEFREILTDLGKAEREIDLLIDLEREGAENDLRRLTVAQVRAAWEENVLSDNEAVHWLGVNRFGDQEIGLIMRTWKAEIEPEFRRVNKGTVIGAYIAAVLNRSQASLKLQEIGFSPEDARLELDLAEARSPEIFGLPAPKVSRYITPGMLSELLEATLITPAVMRVKLLEQNYSEADSDLLVQAAVLRAEADPRPLNEYLISRAYASLVLDRPGAFSRLLELEYEEVDANIILDTVEAENPSVFAPESVQAVRVPTVGAIVEAVRLGIIEVQEFYVHMAELDYTRESADMYLALAVHTERKRVKALTKAEINKLYDMEIFDLASAMIYMMGLGYSDLDASLILRTVKSGIEFTQVWKSMLLGLITVESAVEQLFGMGFTDEEIELAFTNLTKEAEGD